MPGPDALMVSFVFLPVLSVKYEGLLRLLDTVTKRLVFSLRSGQDNHNGGRETGCFVAYNNNVHRWRCLIDLPGYLTKKP